MAFKGNEGGPVNLETLQKSVERHKAKNPGSINGHFFGKDCINQLLNQPGSVGIRALYGIDESGEFQLFLVSVDENEKSLLPGSGIADAGGEFLIMDHSRPCPPYC